MAETLHDLGSSFRRHLRAENKSERTCTIYLQSVRFLAAWLTAAGLPPTLDQLTRANVLAWLADLSDRHAHGTVRTRWKGLHRFCGWLVAEGVIDVHPMHGLEVPEVPERPVPVLTDDQLAALIKACQGKRFYDRRDEAVVRFLLDCGVRNSELCGVTKSGLDLDNQMVIVTGKGGKSRPVYFGPRTARALDRYARMRAGHRWADADSFFLGERGPLTTDGVREIVRVRAEAAGIEGAFPHRFRHTWAHDFLLAGGQERDLKRLAGWSSDAMLERYGASAADHRARMATRKLSRGDRV
ncbi:tyrosine-type recombinase/integrase [Actinosynnema sp. CA-248983]